MRNPIGLYPVRESVRLHHQFERRRAAAKPNMTIQQTHPYRVDSVLTGEYVPPNEDNEITMQCFDLLAWQSLLGKSECCGDYSFIWMQCLPGTAEYDNADMQDSITNISGCVDPDVTFGDQEFDNAEMTMDMMSTEGNPCDP